MSERKKDNRGGAGGTRPAELAIDWELFDKLAGIQCSVSEMAFVLGMHPDTVNEACKRVHGVTADAYRASRAHGGRVALRRRQFEIALEGNPTMLIWLGKQMLGQADKAEQRVEHVVRDTREMTREEVEAELAQLDREETAPAEH